ncbi:MAG: hypothetical protein KAJ98_07020 [Spirochaetaceae bacterium]|nr:hypothetical protein [Spirochaetaceae bacterium]
MKFPVAILIPVLSLFVTNFVFSEKMSADHLASWEDHLALARTTGTEMFGEHILLKETSDVQVGTFNYTEDKVVDVFYPPAMDFENEYPVLALLGLSDVANIRETGKPYRYTGQALGWAQWAAENGFVVLVPETGSDPKINLKSLIEWARVEGGSLGIDGNRVGYFSSSHACHGVLKNLRPETRGIPAPSALFAVFYYGDLLAYTGQDTNVPYFVVTVEGDTWVDNDKALGFVEKMRDRGAEVIYENHESGFHGFEMASDNARTREILDATMAFMKDHSGL